MIQWKQRLYAFLLRRIVGPFLDDKSKEKLHESIQVSFQEGIFAVQDVALSPDYLESLNQKFEQQKADENKTHLKISKVRIEKLQISLSLLESKDDGGGATTNSSHSTGSSSRRSRSSSIASEEHEDVKSNDEDECDNANIYRKNSVTTATSGTSEETSTTSFAWRALQLGSRAAIGEVLALFAEVQISGVYVEVEPSSSSASSPPTKKPSTATMASDTEAPSGILSSYVDAALSSLRLSLNINDLRIRIMSPKTAIPTEETATAAATSNRHFIELRLTSASYHDVECDKSRSDKSSSLLAAAFSSSSSYQTILHKVVQFSTISILTGQQQKEENKQEQVLLLSTIAMIDGKGEISLRAIEYTDTTTKHNRNGTKTNIQQPKQVQQDIEVKLNQQIKVSVDEVSLKQIQKVARGFQQQKQEQLTVTNTNKNTEKLNTLQNSNTYLQTHNNENDENDDENEKDLDALTGIMKQYRLARHLAERNEVRGGILVPANAYADKPKLGLASQEEDNDFDIFFDANDKSFHHYGSILQGSFMSRNGATRKKDIETQTPGSDASAVGVTSDFFHTKVRLHVVGGGIKLSFRRSNRGSHAELPSLLMPDEYVLLTFSDMNLTSSVSSTTSDHTFTISHLEIDDSQFLLSTKSSTLGVNKSSNGTNRRQLAEIGSILRFSSPGGNDQHGEALLQPPCISIHTSVRKDFDQDGSGQTTTEVELDLEPIELSYRHGTVSNLITLQKNLANDKEKDRHLNQNQNQNNDHQPQKQEQQHKHKELRHKESLQEQFFHLQCNCSSISLTFPILDDGKNDYAMLYERCGHLIDMSSLSSATPVSSTMTNLSSLSVVMDSISLLYKYEQNIKFQSLTTNSDVNAKLELDHILVFASTPAMSGGVGGGSGGLLTRNFHRMDILTISGLADIEPCIPVSIEYQELQEQQQQMSQRAFFDGSKGSTTGFGAAAAAAMGGTIGEGGTNGGHTVQNPGNFPLFRTISSFKARQEDEDEDLEIDKILSERIRDVGIDSRMGLRGQGPQDSMLECASNCRSLFHIHIPEVSGDLAKSELLILNQMLQNITVPTTPSAPVPTPSSNTSVAAVPDAIVGVSRSDASADIGSRHYESPSSLLGVALTCDRMMLSIHNLDENEAKNKHCKNWISYMLRVNQLNVHSVLISGDGSVSGGGDDKDSKTSNLKQLRFCAHEANLFEAENLVNPQLRQQQNRQSSFLSIRDRAHKVKDRNIRNKHTSAVPLIFRSKLFPAISGENPSFLFDMINEQEDESKCNDDNNCIDNTVQRKKFYFTVYNMTYRYDIDSKCIERLARLLQREEQQHKQQPECNHQKQRFSQSREDASVTSIFVSFADCNVDYSSSNLFKTPSRTIVRVGDLRISSNVMWPATRVQAFSLSIGDVSIYLCPTRFPHYFENSQIAGADLLMNPEELSSRSTPSLQTKKIGKGAGNAASAAADTILKEMDYRIILTLDSMDAIIAVPSTQVEQERHEAKTLSSSSSSVFSSSSSSSSLLSSSSTRSASTEPNITTSITLGELSVYACKDSFKCFMGTVGELQTKLTALDDQGLEDLRAKSASGLHNDENYKPKDNTTDSISQFDPLTSRPNDENNDSEVRGYAEQSGSSQAAVVPMQVTERPDIPTSRNIAEENKGKQMQIPPAEDNEDDFQLDGYDWTTVDHMPSQNSTSVSPGTYIPPGEEQVARWYSNATDSPFTPLSDSISGSSSLPENQPFTGSSSAGFASQDIVLEEDEEEEEAQTKGVTKSGAIRLITQHFPLQVVSNPFGNNDASAAKFAGTKLPPAVQNRVLVHDLRLKLRFFDGYDWPGFLDPKQREVSNSKGLSFIIDEPTNQEEESEIAEEETYRSSGKDNRAKLMGDLLGGNDDNFVSSTFQDCPLPEERGAALLEQSEMRRLSRRANRYLQISVSGVRLKLDAFKECLEEHRLSSCMDLTVMDLFIAETIGSESPVKMMGEWVNDSEHPRDTRDGFLMLKMVTWNPANRVTPTNSVANDEAEVLMTLLPMRCILDQRAIRFARLFFSPDNEKEKKTDDWASKLHVIPPPMFRSFKTKPCKLKIDYKPQKLNFKALKDGSLVELINLSPLDGMVLTLQEVDVEDAEGFGSVMSSLAGQWLQDICATQLHKFLSNSRPLEPITRISGGVSDLFVLPWDAYKNGDSVNRAVRSSLSSLAGTVTYETLTNTSRITGYIAGKMAKVSGSSASSTLSHHDPLPSRPIETPKRIGDASRHALESLARGVQTANYKIVVVPIREYRRKGATGAVTSALKGIPVAVVAPVSGATEALSYTLLSARNQILPEVRKEEEANRRGLHFDG